MFDGADYILRLKIFMDTLFPIHQMDDPSLCPPVRNMEKEFTNRTLHNSHILLNSTSYIMMQTLLKLGQMYKDQVLLPEYTMAGAEAM